MQNGLLDDWSDGVKSLRPVVRVTSRHVAYHLETKYLRYYLACEAGHSGEQEAEEEQENDSSESEDDEGSLTGGELETDVSVDETGGATEPTEQPYTLYNPLVPLAFLKQLVTVMSDYFGVPLLPVKIEANYDTLSLLLCEMLEQGYPFITDLNQLKESVQFEGALSRFLSSATSSVLKSTGASGRSFSGSLGGFGSSSSLASMKDQPQIPWRKNNVKYSNNELFVDISEKIFLVMSPSRSSKASNVAEGSAFYNTASNYRSLSKPVLARLEGEITLTSRLSGVPDLQLVLNGNGHNLGIPAFHPCIRVDKWLSSPGVLSFIPPDGKSTLANYEIDFQTVPYSNQVSRSMGIIQAEYRTDLGQLGNEFEIIVYISNLKTVKNIEELKVEINTELHNSKILTIKVLRISNGDFQFDLSGKSLWVFDKNLATGANATLRGIVVAKNEDQTEDAQNSEKPIFPNHASLSFSYKGGLPSGISVASLKVVSAKGMGENVKLYKGVKYWANAGEYILR